MSCLLCKPYTNGRISLDVQSPCCPCVSSRSRSQLKIKYLTNKYYTLCSVRSITALLIEGFPSNLIGTFTSTRGCAEPMLSMCQVTVKGKILNKQILGIMFCLLCKSYTNGKKSSILAQLPMCQFKVKVTIEGQLSAQGQGHN